MTEDVLGYSVFCGGECECVTQIVDVIMSGRGPAWLACLNPHSYVTATRDVAAGRALGSATWLVPDGIGIAIASRILGGTIRTRVTGADIFDGLHRRMADRGGCSIFLLGSTVHTLKAVKDRLEMEYPSLWVAGMYSPPFKTDFSEADVAAMCVAVNACSPDILWVSMSAPKQEKWIAASVDRLDVKFIGAVGAVFDFYIGKVKRASWLTQRVGLEWFPRLLQEPKRLWRRMFVSAPIFVAHVLRERFKRLDLCG
jgi:N-acetylglucosaminyldiphosphoundecaprenol N-acetyl-beta-D-mannosaminyltransferase